MVRTSYVSPHFKSDNIDIWREVWIWDTLPALNFVKIVHGDLYLWENFYQKIDICAFFSYFSPYFYTDNVEILLKRTDRLRNPSKKQIFVKIAQGACRYCMHRGDDAY